MALADPEVIQYMNRVKYPYNVNYLTQTKALEMLGSAGIREKWVKEILEERTKLKGRLEDFGYVLKIFPSDANFLLVRVEDADGLYAFLYMQGVIVRNRSRLTHCEGCIRITVGTPDENKRLIELMKSYPQ
jgi:histidinol-phosphate aminotransferase